MYTILLACYMWSDERIDKFPNLSDSQMDVLKDFADWLERATELRTGADGAVAEESPKNLRTEDSDAGAMGDAG